MFDTEGNMLDDSFSENWIERLKAAILICIFELVP